MRTPDVNLCAPAPLPALQQFFYVNIGLAELGLNPVPCVAEHPVSEGLFNTVNAWSLMWWVGRRWGCQAGAGGGKRKTVYPPCDSSLGSTESERQGLDQTWRRPCYSMVRSFRMLWK